MNQLETPTEPQGVRAYDQDGREVIVPREQWAREILPKMIEEAWHQPDQLYAVILNSLNDGFTAEVSAAAAQLYATDPVPARGVCMWSILLMQTDRIDEARQVLETHVATHAEDGSVLVNLARVYSLPTEAHPADQPRAETTLNRALEIEPNLENGLGWLAALEQERGGEPAARAALERIRLHPASWRAQLWLARPELAAGNLAAARILFLEAVERAPRPVPPELLMQISGDLGNGGHLAELIEFTAPHFIPGMHGLAVGNNLIKALVDTNQIEPANALLTQLKALPRPDWTQALAFWDAEITRRRADSSSATLPGEPARQVQPAQQIQIGMLRVDGPIWLPPGSPARSVFGVKDPAAPSVTFLGGSAEAPEAIGQVAVDDVLGRLTRSLPLFLAEQTDLRTSAHGRAMLPWAVPQTDPQTTTQTQAAGRSLPASMSGFVVSAARWPEATAVQATQQTGNPSDYVVITHLDAEVEPWEVSLVFLRTSDGTRIGELSAEFTPGEDHAALQGLSDEVVDLLSALGPTQEPSAYTLPAGLTVYLPRLEELLAARCATVEGAPGQPLRDPHQTLEDLFTLAATEPDNLPLRLLLIETLGAVERAAPQIAAELRPRLATFLANHPHPTLDVAFTRPTG